MCLLTTSIPQMLAGRLVAPTKAAAANTCANLLALATPPPQTRKPSATYNCMLVCSYLVKQGYNKEGDLVILTPYVGQLRRLSKAVAASNMRVVLSDRDSEELAKLEDEALAAEAAAAGAGTSNAVAAAAAGQAEVGTEVAATSSSSSSLSPVVTDMQSCLRLATIDNFQVSYAKDV
jgi:hypothetical protein